MQRRRQLRVGGVWLKNIGPWSDLAYMHRWPGGPYEASWSMTLPQGFRHPALQRGQLVEVMDGMGRVWSGLLSDPDPGESTFKATGLCREAEQYLCFDAAGNTTSVPDVAVDQAITRGLPWVRRMSLGATAFTATTDPLNFVSALLDSRADELGQRWRVDPDGEVRMLPDPTVPAWHMTPGSVDLGLSSDEYASHIFLRYRGPTGAYATAATSDDVAAAQFGHREFAGDATGLGRITAGKAASLAAGVLAKGKARLGWTSGIEATPVELTTAGGVPADLSLVVAGDLIRIHGLFDEQASARAFVDVVVAESQYTDSDQSISLTPQGMTERTLADVLEASLTKAGRRRK